MNVTVKCYVLFLFKKTCPLGRSTSFISFASRSVSHRSRVGTSSTISFAKEICLRCSIPPRTTSSCRALEDNVKNTHNGCILHCPLGRNRTYIATSAKLRPIH